MEHRATYSPEDNKLRLYPDWDDPDFDKEDAKARGFRWASKQECYVKPRWTPDAEDYLLTLVDEIQDEDYSPLERAADRAERFEGYRGKRLDEATGHADTFEDGPSAFGNQNRSLAERQARRHDRHRTRAVSQWSKAEYWQQRTAGVISHALHRSDPNVRRGRILTLEAEERKNDKDMDVYASRYRGWRKVLDLPGNDQPVSSWKSGNPSRVKSLDRGGSLLFDFDGCDDPGEIAATLANYGHDMSYYKHPRRELDPAQHEQGRESLYKLLGDESDPITPREAAELWLDGAPDPDDADSYRQRWARHYALRLEYEKAMLENEGGKVFDADMVPGGWIHGKASRFGGLVTVDGWAQILSVNKSPATKRVTSVVCLGRDLYGYADPEQCQKIRKMRINIERLPADAYRAPTEEELAAFKAEQAVTKKAAKASAKKQPSLINPTDEDAERLQAVWNERGAELYAKHVSYGEYNPTEVVRITQAQYSAASKGSYSSFETISVCENGHQPRRWDGNKSATNPPIAFKIRKRYGGGRFTAQANAVVIITDKPQKPLPLDWEVIMGSEPDEAGMLF